MMKFLPKDPQSMRDLLAISFPMIVSQGAYAVMMFTDRYFMSMISPTHLSASLGGGVAAFFCQSLFVGVLSYINALVAQAFGADKLGNCSKVLTQGIILSLLCTPFLFVIAYFASFMFTAIGHDPLQAELETVYFKVLMMGAVINLIKVCFGSYFSGIGRTRYVMVADGLGVLMNIPLSFVLIFGYFGAPELGIIGAGIGTLLGSLFTLLIMLLFYLRREHRQLFRISESFVYNKRLMMRHLKFGFPSGLEMFLNVAAFNLFLLMFQSYGVAEGASAAIALNWDLMSFVPMIGLHIGLISLIGRHIGANRMQKADDVIRAGFVIGLGYSAVLGILFLIFRMPLIEIFITPGVESQDIRELSNYMMIGLSTYVMADATILVAGGVLRGAGDTRWLMIMSVVLHWLMLVLQYLVIKVWQLAPLVSWFVLILMVFAIAIVYLWRLKSGAWKNEAVFAELKAGY